MPVVPIDRAQRHIIPVLSAPVRRALRAIKTVETDEHEKLEPADRRELKDALHVLAAAAFIEAQIGEE